METGWNLLWEFALARERNVSGRAPAWWQERIVTVFTYDRKNFFESVVIAISTANGSELWRQTIHHVATEPLIDENGVIYVASFAGAIHAYSPDGAPLWTSAFGEANVNVPVMDGERLFIAETGGGGSKTWCLDRNSGEVIWSYENGGHSYRLLATGGRLFHATAVSGKTFGQSTMHLHCLDQASGAKLWSVTADQYHFQPVMAGGLLLWGARNALNAYDPANGTLKAQLPIPEGVAITTGPVLLADQDVIAADDSGTVRAIRVGHKGLIFKTPQLQERWSASLPDTFIGRPVLAGGHVHILTEKGLIYRFDTEGRGIGPILDADKGRGKGGGLAVAGGAMAVAHGRTLGLYQP